MGEREGVLGGAATLPAVYTSSTFSTDAHREEGCATVVLPIILEPKAVFIIKVCNVFINEFEMSASCKF